MNQLPLFPEEIKMFPRIFAERAKEVIIETLMAKVEEYFENLRDKIAHEIKELPIGSRLSKRKKEELLSSINDIFELFEPKDSELGEELGEEVERLRDSIVEEAAQDLLERVVIPVLNRVGVPTNQLSPREQAELNQELKLIATDLLSGYG